MRFCKSFDKVIVMNFLNCGVSACAHNSNDMCSLNTINVEGPGACKSDQTCCSSFMNSTDAMNTAYSNSACTETEIECKAANCKHYKKGKCQAKDVHVGKMGNDPCVMGETMCDTFSAR